MAQLCGGHWARPAYMVQTIKDLLGDTSLVPVSLQVRSHRSVGKGSAPPGRSITPPQSNPPLPHHCPSNPPYFQVSAGIVCGTQFPTKLGSFSRGSRAAGWDPFQCAPTTPQKAPQFLWDHVAAAKAGKLWKGSGWRALEGIPASSPLPLHLWLG